MAEHAWPHLTHTCTLRFHLSFIFGQKNLRHWFFVPEILMIKESYNLTGQEYIRIELIFHLSITYNMANHPKTNQSDLLTSFNKTRHAWRFLVTLNQCKKTKTLNVSFQRYWRSKYLSTLLDKRTFSSPT